MSTRVDERVLVYPGCGHDILPILLVSKHRHIQKKFDKACAKAYDVDPSAELIAVLNSVDRFVFFDASPKRLMPNAPTELCLPYPTLDHYVKFQEVFLRMFLRVENLVHHEEEHYFECDVPSFPNFPYRDVSTKKLEWHYSADFYHVESPRLAKMVEKASVAYYHFFPGDALEGDKTIFNFTPNVDTVLVNICYDMKWNKMKREYREKFEANSSSETVRVLLTPELSHPF